MYGYWGKIEDDEEDLEAHIQVEIGYNLVEAEARDAFQRVSDQGVTGVVRIFFSAFRKPWVFLEDTLAIRTGQNLKPKEE